MRLLILLFLILISFSSMAADNQGFSGFFTAIGLFFNDIYEFITVIIPRKITEFIFWIKLYLLYYKFYSMLEVLRFSHDLAITFFHQLNISEVIEVATSNLPPDLQKAALDMRVFDSLNLLIEALITRFVYSVVTH